MSRARGLAGGAVFLSAFLLFLVEPMAARVLLPALGGSSAVWLTCLVFFQGVLLLGYLYADWLTKRLTVRRQELVHGGLLALAVAMLAWEWRHPVDLSGAGAHPAATIFFALGAGVGLPFLLLSATSPLVQVWLAGREQGGVRFRLYALSNVGSLLALAAYPLVVEPGLTLSAQKAAWALGFVVFALVLAAGLGMSGSAAVGEAMVAETGRRATRWEKLLWFVLPMAAAMQLAGVTGYLTQNIAAIPLLWVLPLGVYLVTLIVAFDAPRWYRRWHVLGVVLVFLVSLGYWITQTKLSLPIGIAVGMFLAEELAACYLCHAEVYAVRPGRRDEATSFYLHVAAGGAVGSAVIAIACPLMFRANYDIALAFGATAVAGLLAMWRLGWPTRVVWAAAVVGMGMALGAMHTAYHQNTTALIRNFYGPLRVEKSLFPPQAFTVRMLMNGSVEHGTQWFAPEFRQEPTTYYGRESGVGLALANCCAGRPKRVGVIGLGVGTLAVYGQTGDWFRFYEINPAVEPMARGLFTFLKESRAQISVGTGDARLLLAGEGDNHYDVLVVDAFTGDAIPVHLLTREAMALYRRHLAEGGVVAFHVSNDYLNLPPAIALVARDAGMEARVVHSPAQEERGVFQSTWVLVSANRELWKQPAIAKVAKEIKPVAGLRVWTDDYSSLLPILKWLGQ